MATIITICPLNTKRTSSLNRFLLMFIEKKSIQNKFLRPICGALHDLVTLLHGCFSRFLNCTNGIKSRNAPHLP